MTYYKPRPKFKPWGGGYNYLIENYCSVSKNKRIFEVATLWTSQKCNYFWNPTNSHR